MEKIFQDKKQQTDFERNGYIVIPFLSNEEIAFLSNSFRLQFPIIPDGFYSTSFSEDATAKNILSQKVDEVFDPKLADIATSYRKLGNCFLTKSPGKKGEMPIHQDWTVVDETKFQSLTIWVPLCDVDYDNGALQVIPGSHRFLKAIRSPSIPDHLSDIWDEIRKDLISVTLKAGEAIIFSQGLIHASPPNTSDKIREVITFGFIPGKADLFFHYLDDKKGIVEKYKVPDDFFEKYNTNIGGRPNVGEKVGEHQYIAVNSTVLDYRKMKQMLLNETIDLYTMLPIFKDENNQRIFEQEGYFVAPLLEQTEVEELNRFYHNLNIKDDKGYGFHVTMDQEDKSISRVVRDKIWGVAIPALGNYLKDFKPFVASFVIKDPNPKGVVPAHQDWSFTDGESEGFCSITCWVSLVDTTIDNGAMGVIRGSHKMLLNRRPSPSPQVPVPLANHMFSIFPYLKTIEMKAGDVLMFDNRTFHASPPNTTEHIRLAAGIGVTQKDARLVHYYLKPDGTKSTMLKYAVDEDFFLKYNNAELSSLHDKCGLIEGYELLGEERYNFENYTSEELVEFIKAAGNEFNVPMCEKLSQLFGYNLDGTSSASKKEESLDEKVASTNNLSRKSFFEIYTPYNIYREIKFRITGK